MQAHITKWGNSFAIRLPLHFIKTLGIRNRQPVSIEIKGQNIVISPGTKKYLLKDLVEGITQKNRHTEIDFGQKEGEEEW
jgi:antitoxin MazE